MDQDVINLAKAIREHESGGNYNAQGTSTESGAFQYMPNTWKSLAKKWLGSETAPLTPENQKAVAYLTIKADKDAGLNPAQIAAKWNSGTTTWEGKVGKNKYGVQYDVPKYVQSVTSLYQQYKKANPAQPVASPSAAAKFKIAATPEDHNAKMAKYQAEAAAAADESKKANSFMGIFKNTAKGTGEAIASSEVGLGNTIGGIIGTNKYSDMSVKTITDVSNQQADLLKRIHEGEAVGKDTTKLKKIYNDNIDLLDEARGNLREVVAPTEKTGLQVGGELAGTALDLFTAGSYGKGARAAQSFKLAKGAEAIAPTLVKGVEEVAKKPAGIFTKKGAARIGEGAAVGYGYDVSQNAQGGKTGGALFTPGVGTAIGAGLPLLGAAYGTAETGVGKIKKNFTKSGRIEQRATAFEDIFNSGVKTKKALEESKGKGYDPSKFLASDDRFIPEVVDGKVVPDKAINALQEEAKAPAKIVRGVIDSENKWVPLQELHDQALTEVERLKDRGAEYESIVTRINKDFESYKKFQNQAGEIPLAKVDDFKKAKYEAINWNDPEKLSADRAIGKASRKVIEDNIPETSIRDLNHELGRIYDAQEMLEGLGGRAVKGGRLGKYFARGFGLVIGNSVGGPGGAVIGMMTGDKLADIMQTSYFGNPILKKVVSEIKSERPGIFAEAEKIIEKRKLEGKNRLALPGPGQTSNPTGDTIFATPKGKLTTVRQEAHDISAVETGKTKTTKKLGRPKNPLIRGDHFYEKEKVIDAGKKSKAKGAEVNKLGAPKVFSPELKSLATEAKKYKSAEEFVKAQGKPLYHGSKKADVIRKEGFKLPASEAEKTDFSAYGDGVYFSTKKSGAYDNTYSHVNTIEGYVPNDLKLYKAYDKDAGTLNIKKLKTEGFDGVEVNLGNEKHIVVFDPAKIRTKEQLVNLYDKVHGTVTDISMPNILKPLKSLAEKSKTKADFISKANLNGNIVQTLAERYRGEGIEGKLTDFYNKVRSGTHVTLEMNGDKGSITTVSRERKNPLLPNKKSVKKPTKNNPLTGKK